MFGLFKKRPEKPSVTNEDKDWIEKNISGYIEQFGLDHLEKSPFLIPEYKIFPYSNLRDGEQLDNLFKQVCRIYDIDPNEIDLVIFEDVKSKTWFRGENVPVQIKKSDPLGIYVKNHLKDQKKYKVLLAKSNFKNIWSLIATLSHELAHVKLLGKGYMADTTPDLEPLTDLACIFFGFGLFLANSVISKDDYWMSRQGYIPNEMISYSNALLCYITGKKATDYAEYLNENTHDIFLKDFQYLVNTNDTALDKERVSELSRKFNLWEDYDKCLDDRKYREALDCCIELLAIDNKNIYAVNGLGYVKMLMNHFDDAISDFNSAIDINPYFDYAYSNRGLCKMFVGDIEDAYFDVSVALDMNPDNSFAWRNMGIFLL